MRKKVEFPSQGQYLAGLLETPDQKTRAYVLFAHCFTCGKSFTSNISYNRHIPTCQNKK